MNVFIADEQDDPLPGGALLELAEAVLRSEGVPEGSEVAIVFIDEVEMASLNERHGLLHLLGWDHEEEEEAERMEARERQLLASVGRVRP